jgi:hypothetical protein
LKDFKPFCNFTRGSPKYQNKSKTGCFVTKENGKSLQILKNIWEA